MENISLNLDWDDVLYNEKESTEISVESVSDGLIHSIRDYGKVDIEYISRVSGKDRDSVIEELKGVIFLNPEKMKGDNKYVGWETSDEYLSGNLKKKLLVAKHFNILFNGEFKRNVDALSNLVTDSVIVGKDVYVGLGTPWLTPKIIASYILDGKKGVQHFKIYHDRYTKRWVLENTYDLIWRSPKSQQFSTKDVSFLDLIRCSLNSIPIIVKKKNDDDKEVLDHEATILAQSKQKALEADFIKWLYTHEDILQEVQNIYNSTFGNYRVRRYDGSMFTFPGMNPQIKLFDYQKNAVARIILSKNTLLAHEVGSGKTFIMIAAGMEMRRMGISKKNLYIVPNSILEQWKLAFLELYPKANIFVVDSKNFSKSKREKTLKIIKEEDFDGIIIPYSSFDQIACSKQWLLQEALLEYSEIKNQEDNYYTQNASTPCHVLQKKRNKLDKKRKELEEAVQKQDSNKIFFDELGITRIFVDEAHNYKNIAVGENDSFSSYFSHSSKKCDNMLEIVRFIQKNNEGGGVVFATGTPITNSITDAYVMQNYLQPGELSLFGINSFSDWRGMFAQPQCEFEIDIDTTKFRNKFRLSRFYNLNQLTKILATIADFHKVDRINDIPDFQGYTDTKLSKTPEFEAYLQDLSNRATNVRTHRINNEEDNLLKITNDGRKAALDLRLIDNQKYSFSKDSKVFSVACNVKEIYTKTQKEKSTQVVFCDISTPKDDFNVYDELKKILVIMRVNERDIAFIHNAETDQERERLFEKVRQGEIRVLVGSTQKLGIGVNIQNKLIAVHHLDVPWRPSDMVQREGRILRKYNTNKEVFIYRYITEGSFDAYSWQLLETKQRFISELLAGSLSEKESDDIDSTVLSYAEIKALAIGNPLIKERFKIKNELDRLYILNRKTREDIDFANNSLLVLPERIENQAKSIANIRQDCLMYKEEKERLGQEKASYKDYLLRRKELSERIYYSIKDYHLKPEERLLTSYYGFDLVLPANMLADTYPYIFIIGNEKYRVNYNNDDQIGDYLRKIDEKLRGLDDIYISAVKKLEQLKDEQVKYNYIANIKGNPNSEKILELEKLLKEIDKKLGVKNV